MTSIETLSEQMQFGGVQGFYRHVSSSCAGVMRFGVFRPPQARNGKTPVLYCLAGLTCSEETFAIKAGAQRLAAELGLTLVTPDTSPRNTGIPDEAADWEVGAGAGFYVDATRSPWSGFFNMHSYVADELPAVIAAHFAIDGGRCGILGHSMGGHGALMLALRHPEVFKSVSAFAPIAAPMQSPWGRKAFSGYLGSDESSWSNYDATVLMQGQTHAPYPKGILIDQGLDDKFLAEQLHPELFAAACQQVQQPLNLRQHPGYDHGYYFINSFIEDHLMHHKKQLME